MYLRAASNKPISLGFQRDPFWFRFGSEMDDLRCKTTELLR
jgi:hypothetical protein